MLAINGEVVVFENVFKGSNGEYTRYSLTVGNKDQQGKYHNTYFDVKFLKDAIKGELPTGTGKKGIHLLVTEAFLSTTYYTKNNIEVVMPQLVIKKAKVL